MNKNISVYIYDQTYYSIAYINRLVASNTDQSDKIHVCNAVNALNVADSNIFSVTPIEHFPGFDVASFWLK